MTPAGPGKERLLNEVIQQFAENGIGDTSLRALAASIGTSHRMLIYHFGSRQGLLQHVVDRIEANQRDLLGELLDQDLTPAELVTRYWHEVTEAALKYGPLFFELSGQAMQGQPHAVALRDSVINAWLDPLAELWMRAGHDRQAARAHARLGLAVARGLLFDLLITGDRAGVDGAMVLFAERLAVT